MNRSPLPRTGPFRVPDGLVDETVPLPAWSDATTVRAVLDDLCARYEIAGTYAAFEATLPWDAELRARAGLPGNDPAAVRALLDKAAVRDRLRAAGLTGLRSTTLTAALRSDSWDFPGAAVLKPAHGTGSALCFTVSSPAALRAAAGRIRHDGPASPLTRDYVLGGRRPGGTPATDRFVLEQRAEGELLSVESLVHGGTVHTVGLTGRYVLAADRVVEQATVFPYAHPRQAEITAAAHAYHRALGFTHGPTHLEVMVPEDGPVELIDFNPRAAGVAAVPTFSLVFGTPYERLLTDLGCGRAPDTAALRPTGRCAADTWLLPPPGTTRLRDVGFPPEALLPRLLQEPGPLSGRSDQLDTVAMFVLAAGSPAALHRDLLAARRRTTVNGVPLGDNPNNHLIAPAHLAPAAPAHGRGAPPEPAAPATEGALA